MKSAVKMPSNGFWKKWIEKNRCAVGVTRESESEGWQKLSTLDSRFSTLHFGKIIDSKIIFGTTIEHGGRCEKEQPKVGPKGEGVGTTESNDSDLHGWAEMRRAVLGRAKLAVLGGGELMGD